MNTALLLSSLLLPNYGVVQKIPIGGEGGWDCLRMEPSSHRLFISRGTHVMVLDVQSGKLVGDIPNTNGVHDMVLLPKLGKGYISDGRDNTVTVFDLKTLKELKRVPAGNRPDVMRYDPATKRIFSFNGGSEDATAIDVASDTVAGTVKLDGKPEFPEVDGNGTLYVNIEDKSEIQKVNTKTLKATASWPLTPAEEPSGLAFDKKDGLLFSACSNGLMAISDVHSGKLLTTVAVGNGPDGAAFDSKPGLAFCPNGQDGTLTVVGKAADGKWSALQTLKTQTSARTMAFDPTTHRLYLIAADFKAPETGQRRGSMVPNSAVILVVAPVGG